MFNKSLLKFCGIGLLLVLMQSRVVGQCEAGFAYAIAGEVLTLFDESTGDYVDRTWSVDGVDIAPNSEQVTWSLNDFGFHTVCLTITGYSNCEDTYCNEEIFYGDESTICDYTDCVFPGDADANGSANVYDLLNIGLGYGTVGPPRVSAGLAWEAAYAPNWDSETINGLNYKHFDCNGDGTINSLDLVGIEANYTPAESMITAMEVGAPLFWLEFTEDSVFYDENSPSFFTVEAKLMVADAANPITDLKGFSLTMNYPQDIVQAGSPEFDYKDNSFFGNSNQILWMPYDRPDDGKLDIAFAKKWGTAEGHGEIGTLQIIIVGDIIGGRSETYTPVKISLEGLTAIDANGAIKTVGMPVEAEMTIVNSFNTTATEEQILAKKIAIYPNPANDFVTIDLTDLKAERISIFNQLGQEVFAQEAANGKIVLNVEQLESGMYLVKVQTLQHNAYKWLMVGG